MSLSVEMHDHVALVTFQDAQRMNSFDARTLTEIRQTFLGLLADEGVHAMVLTGTGNVFSTGADVAEFQKSIDDGRSTEFVLAATAQLHPLMLELHGSDKPLVAAVNGVAAGGGLGLALVADARIGSPAARFAAGYFGLGVSPDGGSTWLLPRLIGQQRARRFFFDNEVMDGATALELGVLDELVEPDALLQRAIQVATTWGAWAKHSRESTKRLLECTFENSFVSQLDLERGLIAAAAGTADFREGVDAFLAKRRPVFGAQV